MLIAWVGGDPDQAVSEVLQRGAELLIPCGSSASVAAKRLPVVTLDENCAFVQHLHGLSSLPGLRRLTVAHRCAPLSVHQEQG
jgi:hypothetical protein